MTTQWKCNLSQDGILTGYTLVEPENVQPGDLVFDEKPDLSCGQYRWNGEQFEVANKGQWFMPDGPDAWYAFFRALTYLQGKAGIDFPAPVKLWMKYYYNSFRRPNDPDPGA